MSVTHFKSISFSDVDERDIITLPVPKPKIQSMISDSLVRDSLKQQPAKSKSKPPPPVQKKPKNPFGKDVTCAMDKPRPYSDILQKNIKMGRRESALHYVTENFDKSPSDLDMLSFCPGTLDSPCNMCVTGGFDPGLQSEVNVSKIYSDLDGKDMDLWTKIVDIIPEPGGLDISHRHKLEKKAKIKGPPPPVPKKPLNPYVAAERDVALPINVSILKNTAGTLTYESWDYNLCMHKTGHEEEPETNSATDRVTNGTSNTLDEIFFCRFRPELIKQTKNEHKKKTQLFSQDNSGHQGSKVLEMTKTSDVKKPFPSPMEGRPLPKKGEFILY